MQTLWKETLGQREREKERETEKEINREFFWINREGERERRGLWKKMGDVVLFVDDLESKFSISYCRICHEEELESCKSLEAPCACSGTVKVKEKAF